MKAMEDSSKMERTSSVPDLNAPNQERRSFKRKERDEDDLPALFRSFSEEISTKLTSMKIDLEAKITSMREDITNAIKSDIGLLRSEITSTKNKQDELSAEQEKLIERTDRIEIDAAKNSGEISDLKGQIQNLQYDLNLQQQSERAKNIKISCVPEKSREDLKTYVIDIARYVGITITSSDILHITRVQSRSKISGRPKSIIAEMSSRLLRDSILSAVRGKKRLTTTDINIAGEPKNIYVNEHLTPSNKYLYLQTRRKANAAKFQFTWVRDGKIFVRKDDVSPVIFIKCCDDLQKIS
ncbi:hypothetical protein NE865_16388 [Phthorimaea operculella]|nr:hypothetical protein NE865_16388 [Phthorimaea operculella]